MTETRFFHTVFSEISIIVMETPIFLTTFKIFITNQGDATGTRQAPLYLVCLGVVSIDPSLQSDTQDYLTI